MIIDKNKIGYDTTKKFVFITTSYNSSKYINYNLESIKVQDYSKDKYRIIYVNDCSTDDSEKILSDFILKNKTINMRVINNKQNMGPAYSRYISYNEASDDEICIFLDGDDWLINKNTLKILSYVYSNFDIYATFGSMDNNAQLINGVLHKGFARRFSMHAVTDPLTKKPIQNLWFKSNYHRKKWNYFPHLRTSYAYLCKKVPTSYLKYNDIEWFKFKSDVALFTSIIELCNSKYAFITLSLIHYNLYNSLYNPDTGCDCKSKTNEQKQKRSLYGHYISNLKKLEPIINSS